MHGPDVSILMPRLFLFWTRCLRKRSKGPAPTIRPSRRSADTSAFELNRRRSVHAASIVLKTDGYEWCGGCRKPEFASLGRNSGSPKSRKRRGSKNRVIAEIASFSSVST